MCAPNRAVDLAWLFALWLDLLLLSPQVAAESSRVRVNTRSGVYHCPGKQYCGE